VYLCVRGSPPLFVQILEQSTDFAEIRHKRYVNGSLLVLKFSILTSASKVTDCLKGWTARVLFPAGKVLLFSQ